MMLSLMTVKAKRTMAKVPTLSASGWVGDVVSMATRLLDYFFSSDYSQSHLYRDNVSSFPYLVKVNGHRPEELKRGVKTTLTRYLSRYFDNVVITASTNPIAEDNDSRYNLTIDINVTLNGREVSLGRAVELGDGRVVNIKRKEDGL